MTYKKKKHLDFYIYTTNEYAGVLHWMLPAPDIFAAAATNLARMRDLLVHASKRPSKGRSKFK